jgi:hypothetical protein
VTGGQNKTVKISEADRVLNQEQVTELTALANDPDDGPSIVKRSELIRDSRMTQKHIVRIIRWMNVNAPDGVIYRAGALIDDDIDRIVLDRIATQLVASFTETIEFREKAKVAFVAAGEANPKHLFAIPDFKHLITVVAFVTTSEFIPVLVTLGGNSGNPVGFFRVRDF